jgi:hypothetical protein
VFQEPRLLPWQRVLPNVWLGLDKGVRPGSTGRGTAAPPASRGCAPACSPSLASSKPESPTRHTMHEKGHRPA